MTVVSIVFAILLMTLTLASMQFSPRILVSFVRDRTTQWTLGIFLGTFSYCMAALAGGARAADPVQPGGHGGRRDAAGAAVRRLADLLHQSHLPGNQRQPYRGPDRWRDRTCDRRTACRIRAAASSRARPASTALDGPVLGSRCPSPAMSALSTRHGLWRRPKQPGCRCTVDAPGRPFRAGGRTAADRQPRRPVG